jgi:hypothetical protein
MGRTGLQAPQDQSVLVVCQGTLVYQVWTDNQDPRGTLVMMDDREKTEVQDYPERRDSRAREACQGLI